NLDTADDGAREIERLTNERTANEKHIDILSQQAQENKETQRAEQEQQDLDRQEAALAAAKATNQRVLDDEKERAAQPQRERKAAQQKAKAAQLERIRLLQEDVRVQEGAIMELQAAAAASALGSANPAPA
ncbi:unnamed protein product, partial [Pylaiella littoralis]